MQNDQNGFLMLALVAGYHLLVQNYYSHKKKVSQRTTISTTAIHIIPKK